MQRFAGKSIIVTGAASGIGRAVVLRLCREGGQVLAVDRDAAGLADTCAQAGAAAQSCVLSVADEAAVEAAVSAYARQQGGLHVLANMAGILRADHSTQLTRDNLQAVLDVNLFGTFFMCRASLPHLEKTGGNIVNTASAAALFGTPYTAAYAASKGAVASLTQALAWEYITRGVRVNAVAPGGIATPMTASHGANMPDGVDFTLLARLMRPDMRMGEPDDVAGVVAMLASDDGRNMTGAIIRIDGGVHA